MINRLFLLVGVGGLALTSASVHAQILISLASSNGNASTQTAAYGITPSGGQTNQFLLTTINPASALPANGSLGTTPANTNITTLNTYFGLPTGTLAGFNAQDGSGYLSQQVTLLAGAVVRFDYIFLTSEDNTLPTTPAPSQFHNDRAFFTVNGVLNSTIYQAASLSVAQLNAGSASPNFNYQSTGAAGNGYTTATYTVPTTGNYTFGFGVIDVDTNTVYSGLLIDNLNFTIVPEPGTNALLGLGAASGALALWRKRPRCLRRNT